VLIEQHLTHWQGVLDGVYRGDLTLCFLGANQVGAFPRGLVA
jgi:hypothetical protein